MQIKTDSYTINNQTIIRKYSNNNHKNNHEHVAADVPLCLESSAATRLRQGVYTDIYSFVLSADILACMQVAGNTRDFSRGSRGRKHATK
jgi:hypothetical protein